MQKATQTLWTAVLTVLIATGTMAQAPDKAAPFTAVKWDNDHPVVRMDNEWYSLLKINDTDVNHIIEYCKKNMTVNTKNVLVKIW
ncbi:MAG: hypothetical protein U5L96_06425 [Owenweeksia sp.]|nr:hypothetical protein [Owenweeksia sp.]